MSDKQNIVERAIAAGHVDEANRNSTDPKHAPISFGGGSVDIGKLETELADIAKAKPEERDAAVEAALEKSSEGRTDRSDPSAMPGYKMVDVPHDEIEGLTERTLAFDPEAAAAAEEAEAQVEEERTAGAESVSVAGTDAASPAAAPAGDSKK